MIGVLHVPPSSFLGVLGALGTQLGAFGPPLVDGPRIKKNTISLNYYHYGKNFHHTLNFAGIDLKSDVHNIRNQMSTKG